MKKCRKKSCKVKKKIGRKQKTMSDGLNEEETRVKPEKEANKKKSPRPFEFY